MYTRDPNTMLTEAIRLPRDCPLISATVTLPLATMSFEHAVRISRAELMVDANYAADTTNYYTFTLQQGATVIASWSTKTSAQGALTAATPVQMVLSATDTNLVIPANTVVTLVATKAAAGANITPRVVLHGTLLG